MNYDAFEREVLGHQSQMRCRAERHRVLRGDSKVARVGIRRGGRPVRYRLAGALRSLANQLDAHPARLA